MATADWLKTNLKIRFSEFDFHNSSSSDVPNRALYEDVRAVGNTSYEAYFTPIFLENRRKPWRSTMKAQAKYLSEFANRCLETRQNETEWRFKLEGDVMNRFDTEVNCTSCRAVIWRAPRDPTVATNFKKRHRICQCKPRNKEDNVDDGLSRIFDYHASTEIEYDKSIPAEHREHPKPDRLYGLRQTDRITRLLHETPTLDGSLIGEKIKFTPFMRDDEKLLFPFIVSEVKSERSADSRSRAQKQSACVIITCLELQAKLAETVRSMNPDDQSLEQKPLVWFLCNKGEQWYVAIASFKDDDRSSIRYQVDTLWDGRITDPEGALRLLLIMDYVCDWARDVYRKNIIDQLLALAANPTSTLADDTDILTIVGGQHRDLFRDFDFMESQPYQEELNDGRYSILDLFEMFDIDHPTTVVLRDARYMVHDVLGIDITPENFEEFFLSLKKDKHADRDLARKIERAICEEHAWRVSAETLDAIEFLWTGFDRDHGDFRDKDAKFLVNFTISSQLDGTIINGRNTRFTESRWHQRHTLKFVAVAETAIELISSTSQRRIKPDIAGIDVKKDEALNMFQKIRHATVRQCLAAALSSVQRMTSVGMSKVSSRWSKYNQPIFDNVIKGHQTSELPIKVYQSLKTGRSEPEKTFLRLSQSPYQEQVVRENDAVDWLTGTKLISETDHVVFAYAISDSGKGQQRQRQSHCIFVIDPTPTMTKSLSHSNLNGMSAQSGRHHEQTQQLQRQFMSVFRVLPAPEVSRRPVTSKSAAFFDAVSSRDFDWFVEYISNEWSRLNQFIRYVEEARYTSDFDNLKNKIQLRYGADQEVQEVVRVLVGIGISLRFRELIRYLRNLVSRADLPDDDRSNKGKAKANAERQKSVPISKTSKRHAEEDVLDLSGPSKRHCSSEEHRRASAKPPKRYAEEDGLDLSGFSKRHRSSERHRIASAKPPKRYAEQDGLDLSRPSRRHHSSERHRIASAKPPKRYVEEDGLDLSRPSRLHHSSEKHRRPSAKPPKRYAKEDGLDLSRPLKRHHSSKKHWRPSAKPPKRHAGDGELNLSGPSQRHRSSKKHRRPSAKPPKSPALPCYIIIEDTDEDEIVRTSPVRE